MIDPRIQYAQNKLQRLVNLTALALVITVPLAGVFLSWWLAVGIVIGVVGGFFFGSETAVIVSVVRNWEKQ